MDTQVIKNCNISTESNTLKSKKKRINPFILSMILNNANNIDNINNIDNENDTYIKKNIETILDTRSETETETETESETLETPTSVSEDKNAYYYRNREKKIEYQKKYNRDQGDKIKNYNKDYYQKRREEILQKAKTKITCECGCEVQLFNMNSHKKTKKHLKAIELKNIQITQV